MSIKTTLKGILKSNIYDFKHGKKSKLSKSTYARLSKHDKFYRKEQSANFNDHKIHFAAPFWFLHSVHELFVGEVYRFKSDKQTPYIIDCGANIGLSVIYFKELFKDAKVLAFEADPTVYKQLQKNLGEYKYNNLDLVNAAVWDSKTTLKFSSEGS
ncbi:MAG: FkbM family methyltransferase, partial [Pedobacter sp.]